GVAGAAIGKIVASPRCYPSSQCRGAAIRKSLKNSDTFGGNADNWLTNAKSYGRGRPRPRHWGVAEASRRVFQTRTTLTIKGGRLVPAGSVGPNPRGGN